MPNKLTRFHQIDGLRAVAVIIVISLHSLIGTMAIHLKKSGFILISNYLIYFFNSGVELFYVISGVVLLRPYLRRERIFDIRRYIIRRIERIWPPYFVTFVFTGLVVLIGSTFPTWYSAGVEFKFSWYTWLKQLFIINIGTTYNSAWWSLNVEIIFYLLIPFIISILMKYNKHKTNMLIIFISLLILSELVNSQIKVTRGIIINSVNMAALFIIYLPCFFSGIMLASHDYDTKWGYLLLVCGLLYVAISVPLCLSVNNGFGILYFGLVIVSFNEKNAINRLLQSEIMVWIGERSYSIFLIHFTIFYLTNYIVSYFVYKDITYFIFTRLIGIPASFLCAMALFYYVERHFAKGLVTGNSFWLYRKSINRQILLEGERIS